MMGPLSPCAPTGQMKTRFGENLSNGLRLRAHINENCLRGMFVSWLIGSLEYIFLIGVFALILGVLVWLIQLLLVRVLNWVSAERVWALKIWPAVLISLGIIGLTLPAAITHFVPPDLGPHDVLVEGERRITLTGWDRSDYAVLILVSDARVLQMANEDVNDETLEYLRSWTNLRELDVAGAHITDAGLQMMKQHTTLEKLILSRTKITDAGLQPLLDQLPHLKQLDVRETAITPALIRSWRKADPQRKALPRVSLEDPPSAATPPETIPPVDSSVPTIDKPASIPTSAVSGNSTPSPSN